MSAQAGDSPGLVRHGKLVRDRIPEMIEANGETAVFRVLSRAEYREALFEKVLEEVAELRAAAPVDQLGELADVHEVLAALTEALGHTRDEVELAAERKRAQRGGFGARILLEATHPGR